MSLSIRIRLFGPSWRWYRGLPNIRFGAPAHAGQVPVPGLSVTLREWRTMLPFTMPQRPSLPGSSTFAARQQLDLSINFQICLLVGLGYCVLRGTRGKLPIDDGDNQASLDAKNWKQEAQTSAKSFLPPHSCPGKACVQAAERRRYSIGCTSPFSLAMF